MALMYVKQLLLREKQANKVYETIVNDLTVKNDELYSKLCQMEEVECNKDMVKEM